jgi:hypothetical protein
VPAGSLWRGRLGFSPGLIVNGRVAGLSCRIAGGLVIDAGAARPSGQIVARAGPKVA